MARARMLHRTIATDKRLNKLSPYADWMYIRAIPHLDRDGIIDGDPDVLAITICPWRLALISDEMPSIIDEWVKSGLVIRYKSGDRTALYFCGFEKNQRFEYIKEARSVFGPPPGMKRTKSGLICEGECESSQTTSDQLADNSQSTRRVLAANEMKLNEMKSNPMEVNTTPLPPTQTANSGGGGDAHPVGNSVLPNSPKTTVPVKAQVATVPVEPVTANAAPPVATPPPAAEPDPLAELSNLLLANGFGELRPATKPQVLGWVSMYQLATIQEAIRTAVANGKSSLNYVEGVLKGNGRKGHETSNQNNGRTFGAIPAINAFAGNGANYATNQPGGERDYLYNPLTPEEKEQRRAARRAENDRIRAEMAAEATAVKLH